MYILEIENGIQRESVITEILKDFFESNLGKIEDYFSNPDFIYLASSEKTKTNKISIEDVHKFKEKLWTKPEGNIKIAIINNAHNLTTESQNALLKDLEEEPEDTITILATTDKRLLLPTILSRGISLKIGEISLIHPSIKQEKITEIVYNTEEHVTWDIEKFVNMQLYDKLVFISKEIEKDPREKTAEGVKKADLVESFLSDLLSYYERALLDGNNVSHNTLLVEDALVKIRRGVNPKAVLEYITLSIHNG